MTSASQTELLDELEKGLEGVTDGPWEAQHADSRRFLDVVTFRYQSGSTSSVALVGNNMAQVGASELDTQNANAAHIARCSPENIRALIALARSADRPLEVGSEPVALKKRPTAFIVRYASGEYDLFGSEELAAAKADENEVEYFGLYERDGAPTRSAEALPDEVAELIERCAVSLADVVTMEVDEGIRFATDWRPDLKPAIEQRLSRILSPALSRLSAELAEVRKEIVAADADRSAARTGQAIMRTRAEAAERLLASQAREGE